MSAHTESRWFTPRRATIVGLVLVTILGVALWRRYAGIRVQETMRFPASPPTYVGQERCAPCHAAETEAWRTSHHASAMQVANDTTVLGNFKGANFSKDGVTSSFFTKNGKFYVRTDGP